MSGSLVSASNGELEIWDNFTFYISDIILRGWDQISAERGWSPTIRTPVQGGKKSFPLFLADDNIYGTTYFPISF